MPQHGTRCPAAPSEQGLAHQPVEKARVQVFENLPQIMVRAGRAGDEFATANLPDKMHLPAHVSPVEIEAIAVRIHPGNLAAIQFAEQDISQGFGHRGGSALEQVRHTHVNAVFGQAYEAIRIRERAEIDADDGRRGSRLQVAEDPGIHLRRRFEKQRALHRGNGQFSRKALPTRLHFSRI